MHRSPESPDPSPSDDQPHVRRYRAATMEEALDAARAELGPDVEVIEANRIRRGGVGGFFATDLGIELSAAASPNAGTTTGQAAQTNTAHARQPEQRWDALEPSAPINWDTEQAPAAQHNVVDDEFINPLGGPEQPTLTPIHRASAQTRPLPHQQTGRPAAFDTFERTTDQRPAGLGPSTNRPTHDNQPVHPVDTWVEAPLDSRQELPESDDLMQRDVGEFEQMVARIGREAEAREAAADATSDDTGTTIFAASDEPHVQVVAGNPVDPIFADANAADLVAEASHVKAAALDLNAAALGKERRRFEQTHSTEAAQPNQTTQPSSVRTPTVSPGVADTLAAIDAAAPAAEQQHADLEAAEWLERTLSGIRHGHSSDDAVLDGLTSTTPRAVPEPATPTPARPEPARARPETTRQEARRPETARPTPAPAAAPTPAPAPQNEQRPRPHREPAPAAPLQPVGESPAPTTTAMDYAIGLTQNAAGGLIAQLAAVDAHRGSPMADIKTLSVSVTMPDGAVVDFTAKLDKRDR